MAVNPLVAETENRLVKATESQLRAENLRQAVGQSADSRLILKPFEIAAQAAIFISPYIFSIAHYRQFY